jgi:hypothetical protein
MAWGHKALDLAIFRWIVICMRKFLLMLAAVAGTGAATLAAAPAAGAGQPMRDGQEAFRGVRQGDILPLHVIRDRVRIPGAVLIGVDLVANGAVYRLRFMRGANVMWVDVDARTGRVLGRMGF